MRELSGLSFITALIPLMTAPLSRPNYFSKAQPPNASTLGVRISTYKLGVGDINIQSLTGVEDERGPYHQRGPR